MEFLRFGSSIPGEYWGCCCGDIIQNFKQHPDTKASIQLVDGDGGASITHNGEIAFAGPTLKDIFETRMRIGTFGKRDMPNHFFFVVLEDSQCQSAIGKAWLKMLAEHGFEYLRTVNNSVWNKRNHVFALFRNCGPNKEKNVFSPPKAWTDIEKAVPEAMFSDLSTPEKRQAFSDEISAKQKAIWDAGTTVIRTLSEIEAAGAPVIMAGMRSEFPPELKAKRDQKLQARKDAGNPVQPSAGTQYFY